MKELSVYVYVLCALNFEVLSKFKRQQLSAFHQTNLLKEILTLKEDQLRISVT